MSASPPPLIGRWVLRLDRVGSTNTEALRYADDLENEGLVIVAEEQTAGRGQPGRVWHAPHGSSILFSILLFPPLNVRRSVVLTAMASVAVCEAIFHHIQRQATIKWPNDVLLAGKKVCGILIEQT